MKIKGFALKACWGLNLTFKFNSLTPIYNPIHDHHPSPKIKLFPHFSFRQTIEVEEFKKSKKSQNKNEKNMQIVSNDVRCRGRQH